MASRWPADSRLPNEQLIPPSSPLSTLTLTHLCPSTSTPPPPGSPAHLHCPSCLALVCSSQPPVAGRRTPSPSLLLRSEIKTNCHPFGLWPGTCCLMMTGDYSFLAAAARFSVLGLPHRPAQICFTVVKPPFWIFVFLCLLFLVERAGVPLVDAAAAVVVCIVSTDSSHAAGLP